MYFVRLGGLVPRWVHRRRGGDSPETPGTPLNGELSNAVDPVEKTFPGVVVGS
jgi:hypothetical protein